MLLQETYLSNRDKGQIEKEWGGKIYLTEGTSHSKGLLILISKNLSDLDFQIVYESDRILGIQCNMNGEKLVIFNVYAPCSAGDKQLFLQELEVCVSNFILGSMCFVAGDFNSVLDNDSDIIAGNPHNIHEVERFRKWSTSLELNDTWRLFNPKGKEYTWSRVNPFTARRLDYLFTNAVSFNKILCSEIIPFSGSDHNAVVSQVCFSHFDRGPSYWKLNNSLLKDKKFVDGINQIIEEVSLIDVEAQFKWETCKMKCKYFACDFGRKKAQDRKNEKNKYMEKLKKMEKDLAKDPDNKDLVGKMQVCKRELEVHALYEARSAQIRSKINWIENGEKNTKYFLNLEKHRSAAKVMQSLKTEEGEIYDQVLIRKKQQEYYKELYSKKIEFDESNLDEFIRDIDIPKLSDEDKDLCEGLITEEDACNALKNMKNGSTPGIDGLTTEFYKFFWSKIKDMVVASFNYTFEEGQMSTTQRRGVLTLLHKGKQLPKNDLDNWRAISLTNTDYKILAKVLACRLQRVIKKVVSADQVGYIKGRNIANIHRLIDDVIEFSDLNQITGALIAVDFSKAFDSISKEFIESAFKYFGFGEQFQRWVHILNNNCESAVNYCGWVSSWFPIQAGIRQGCPFSPLAFVLALELFSIKIRSNNNIRGIELPTGVGNENLLKIAQYADDMTLFLKEGGDVLEALKLFDCFHKISGLRINVNKTEAMWLGRKQHSKQTFGNIKWKTFPNNDVKILGVYYSNDKRACDIEKNWTNQIEKINIIMKRWEKRNLSIIGKVHIIKALLVPKLLHVMQSVTIPEKYLIEINRLMYKFIWKKRMTNRKAFEKVKRVILSADYECGGLKMIDICVLQQALLLSWVKKLYYGEQARWKIIPLFYFNKLGENLSVFKSNVKKESFRGINRIKNSFYKKVLEIWLEKNRCLVDNEFDSNNQILWNNRDIKYRGNVLFLEDWIKAGIIYLKDFKCRGTILSLNDIVAKVGSSPRRQLEYNVVLNAIPPEWRNLRGSHATDDIILFRNKELGLWSTKLFRENLVNDSYVSSYVEDLWARKYNNRITDNYYWKILFECTKETRLRVLQWKILHNIYPTRILLKKMGEVPDQLCPDCGEIEYMEHFFFSCEKLRFFWKEVNKIILAKLNKQIQLTEKEAILGIKGGSSFKKVNEILLIAKMCISMHKYGEKLNLKILLEKQLMLRKY